VELKPKFEYYPGERGVFLGVDEGSCTSCGKCRDFCARGVWVEAGGVFRPERQELCAECGACWNACPAGAISLGEPKGGTGVVFSFG
jgi:MinD superfamily P-loop ATPase